MTYEELLLDFYEVKRDHETGEARLAVELQIVIQLEIHHGIGELLIDVPCTNGSGTKM
jgi:hypothetical protein